VNICDSERVIALGEKKNYNVLVFRVCLGHHIKVTLEGKFRYARHNLMDTLCSCYEGHCLLRLGASCCALWRWRDLGSRPHPASDTEIQESYGKGIC